MQGKELRTDKPANHLIGKCVQPRGRTNKKSADGWIKECTEERFRGRSIHGRALTGSENRNINEATYGHTTRRSD